MDNCCISEGWVGGCDKWYIVITYLVPFTTSYVYFLMSNLGFRTVVPHMVKFDSALLQLVMEIPHDTQFYSYFLALIPMDANPARRTMVTVGMEHRSRAINEH